MVCVGNEGMVCGEGGNEVCVRGVRGMRGLRKTSHCPLPSIVAVSSCLFLSLPVSPHLLLRPFYVPSTSLLRLFYVSFLRLFNSLFSASSTYHRRRGAPPRLQRISQEKHITQERGHSLPHTLHPFPPMLPRLSLHQLRLPLLVLLRPRLRPPPPRLPTRAVPGTISVALPVPPTDTTVAAITAIAAITLRGIMGGDDVLGAAHDRRADDVRRGVQHPLPPLPRRLPAAPRGDQFECLYEQRGAEESFRRRPLI